MQELAFFTFIGQSIEILNSFVQNIDITLDKINIMLIMFYVSRVNSKEFEGLVLNIIAL